MATPRELIAQYATQAQMSSFFIDKMGIINVKSYNAKGDGTTDDYTAITNAIAAGYLIYIPDGNYRASQTVIIPANKALILSKGAILKRVSADSSTDPVVRLYGSYSELSGYGKVLTEKASPNGIVAIGPASSGVLDATNTLWAKLDRIIIEGLKANGNIGLKLNSSEPLGGGANYANVISNLDIRSVGTGIKLDPICNAHSFTDINFYTINQYCYHFAGGANNNGENNIKGGFTHFSAGVTVIKLERSLNNHFCGVLAEPGAGSVYYNIDANCSNNLITGDDNCTDASTNLGLNTTIIKAGTMSVNSFSASAGTPRFDRLGLGVAADVTAKLNLAGFMYAELAYVLRDSVDHATMVAQLRELGSAAQGLKVTNGAGNTEYARFDANGVTSNTDVMRIVTSKTPATATAAGTAGQIAWDSNYIYVCVAANSWKRVGIAAW